MKSLRLFICILFFPALLFGQLSDDKKTSVFYINNENASIRAEVLNTSLNKTAEKDISYFWYGSNKIIETQGGYEGKLLHGAYSSFYLSNNLLEKGKFSNGTKQGEWMSWYENGKIQEVSNWKRGRKTSLYQLYNEYGELMVQAHFKNGMLHGEMLSYDGKNIISKKKYRKGIEVESKKPRVRSRKSKERDGKLGVRRSKHEVRSWKRKDREVKNEKEKGTRKKIKDILLKFKKKEGKIPEPEKKKSQQQKVLSKKT